MSLYYFINYLLILTILVLFYIPNNSKVVITANTIAVGIAAFNSILLT